MALTLLYLGLTLLGALQTQAQDSAPSFIPAPPLDIIPLEPNFRDFQFQGKWYFLGMAGNEFQNEIHTGIKMYTVNYKLGADHSYNVTSTLNSDEDCEQWIGSLVPGSQPGQYNVIDIQNLPNIQSYIMQVAATDYLQYAILFFKKSVGNTEYFNIRLYGRVKKDYHILKKIFARFAKALGLTDDHIIFSVSIVCCSHD